MVRLANTQPSRPLHTPTTRAEAALLRAYELSLRATRAARNHPGTYFAPRQHHRRLTVRGAHRACRAYSIKKRTTGAGCWRFVLAK